MSYGIFNPLATNIEIQNAAASRYLRCIKEGVIAMQRNAPPVVAVEFARKAIFSSVRPTAEELDEAIKALKSKSA
jgi:chemotaxis protein MotA